MGTHTGSDHSGSGFGLVKATAFVFVLCVWGGLGLAQEGVGETSTQHYKMLSTVEFDGQGQYRNQVESLFTVQRQPLEDSKVRYSVSSGDFNLTDGTDTAAAAQARGDLSFVVDRATKQVSVDGQGYSFFQTVNNECVSSLKKVTKDNVGKTWKQSIDLPSMQAPFPKTLKFKLKAIQVETDVMGEMIAVRAISDFFSCKAPMVESPDEMGTIRSRIGTVYLFDPAIETIYMSISAFEARSKISGSWEVLRHEVATYMTNESGEALDLSGLGKPFESLVKGLKIKGEGLEVVNPVELPQWAVSEGLKVSQMANICASAACEGASNPVLTVSLPYVNTVQQQTLGRLNSMGGLPMAGGLGAGVPGVQGLEFVAAPAFLGIGAGNAAALGGAAAGGAAAIDNNRGGAGGASPASPF